jgi:hypothetical protein
MGVSLAVVMISLPGLEDELQRLRLRSDADAYFGLDDLREVSLRI